MARSLILGWLSMYTTVWKALLADAARGADSLSQACAERFLQLYVLADVRDGPLRQVAVWGASDILGHLALSGHDSGLRWACLSVLAQDERESEELQERMQKGQALVLCFLALARRELPVEGVGPRNE